MRTIVLSSRAERGMTGSLSKYTASPIVLRTKPAAASAPRVLCTKSASELISKEAPLRGREAEHRGGLVVADSRSDQHDQISRLHLLLLQRVVERHQDARGAGVAPALHDRVRLRHRQPKMIHYQLDRRLAHLGEDDEVDVVDLEIAVRGNAPHEARPALVVDLGRITLDHLHHRAAF